MGQSQEITASKKPRISTIAVNVRCACLTAGSWNALTPLLTASTPVIAVQPLAKARSNNHSVTIWVAGGSGGGGTTGAGCPAAASALTTPNSKTPPRLATNR